MIQTHILDGIGEFSIAQYRPNSFQVIIVVPIEEMILQDCDEYKIDFKIPVTELDFITRNIVLNSLANDNWNFTKWPIHKLTYYAATIIKERVKNEN
jgi:hypothetical protein